MLHFEHRPVLTRGRLVAANCGVAAAYILSAQLAQALVLQTSAITSIWPPRGLAFGALLLWGWRLAPGVGLGAFGVGLLGLLGQNQPSGLLEALGLAAGLALTGASSTLGASWGLRLLFKRRRHLSHLDRLVALLLAGITLAMGNAAAGSAILGATGRIPWTSWDHVALIWSIGDSVGVLLFTPLLLAWFGEEPRRGGRQWMETVICLSLVVVMSSCVFLQSDIAFLHGGSPEVLILPVLAWAALRLGFRWVTAAAVALAVIALWGTARGVGPYAQIPLNDALLSLALSLGCVLPVVLCTTGLVRERFEAEQSLQEINHRLEDQVHRRTEGLRLLAEKYRSEVETEKRLSEALQASEQRWQFALESTGDGIWDWDAQRDQVHFSAQCQTMLGYAASEIPDTCTEWEERLHPADREKTLAEFQAHLEGRTESYSHEYRLRCKDGSYKWILDRGRAIARTAAGQPVRVIGTHSDITLRKEVERVRFENQQRLELAPAAAQIGYWDWNLQTDEVHYSAEWLAQLGYQSAQLRNHLGTWEELLHPEDRAAAVAMATAYLQGGGGEYATEFRMRHRDGSYRWMYARGQLFQDESGVPYRMIGCHVDITERRQAEGALRASESKYKNLFEGAPDAVLLSAADGADRGLTLAANEASAVLYGYSRAELLALRIGDLVGPEGLGAVPERMARVIGGENLTFEVEHRRKDGSLFPSEVRACLAVIDERPCILAFIRDISERVRTEEALRRSEQQLAELIHTINGIVWEADAETFCVTFVSHQTERILGYPVRDWMSGSSFWQDHIHPDDRQAVLNYCAAQTQQGQDFRCQYRMKAADGRTVWVEDFVTQVVTQGRPNRLRGVMVDITKRKQAEEAQRASERQYKLLFDSAPDAVFVIAAEGPERGRILAANQAAAAMHGYTVQELLALSIVDLDGPAAAALAHGRAAQICQGESLTFEVEHRRKDGSLFPVEVRADLMVVDALKCILAFDRDITELRRTERRAQEANTRFQLISRRLIELQEAERRHIACELHDEVGQTLTATKLLLDRLRQETVVARAAVTEGGGLAQAAKLAHESGQHIDRLLQIVRNLSLDLRPPMLDDFGLVSALRWLLDQHARTSERAVELDTAQFNAKLDAVVETACFRIAQETMTNIARHSGAKKISVVLSNSGEGFHLSLRDDGVGFDAAVAQQNARNGMSLGLLSMRERAALLGGSIQIRSEIGKGTEVLAWFPFGAVPTEFIS